MIGWVRRLLWPPAPPPPPYDAGRPEAKVVESRAFRRIHQLEHRLAVVEDRVGIKHREHSHDHGEDIE